MNNVLEEDRRLLKEKKPFLFRVFLNLRYPLTGAHLEKASMKKGWMLTIVALFCSLTADEVKVRPTILLETSCGQIVIELFPEIAPLACENFIQLARSGYYNGSNFHRVIPNFVIQEGDPQRRGEGGKSFFGAPFKDEFSPDVSFDRAGRVGMANQGPNTNGSQFFITLVPTPWLNNSHTLFGQVKEGYETIDKIGRIRKTSLGELKEEANILNAYYVDKVVSSSLEGS